MPSASPDVVHVRVTRDGLCFIDDEYFTPPPGAAINVAVLAHLRLEAAAIEAPLRALIDDEQDDYRMCIQVNPDGSTLPMGATLDSVSGPRCTPELSPAIGGDPFVSPRPWLSLPEPVRTRLADICRTALDHRFKQAASEADALVEELSGEFGPGHIYTLTVGIVRGDVAWLSGDVTFTVRCFLFVARAWSRMVGPHHAGTLKATGNVIAAWRRMSDDAARIAGLDVLHLLNELHIPVSHPGLRNVEPRLRLLGVPLVSR